MTESPIVNEWIALGEARGYLKVLRSIILRVGAKRFGVAPAEIESALNSIEDRERLERIIDRISEATDWNDLLATPEDNLEDIPCFVVITPAGPLIT